MNKQYLEKVFSADRMRKYFNAHPGDDNKAILHYQCNLQISEALYPSLSVLEVALRNAMNEQLTRKFGTTDWYTHFPTTLGLTNLTKEIAKAQQLITQRKEIVTPPKVVAELTLGFWVRLFNREYELILWKDLRKAFPNMEKRLRQRKNVSAPLNHFRTLRNRVFHNEPILWSFKNLENAHNEIIQMMDWLNRDLPKWVSTVDRFDVVLQDVKKKLK